MARPDRVILILWAAGFVALSYVPYFAPRRAFDLPGLTIYWSAWSSTAIILCDAACTQLRAPSLLTRIFASKRGFFSLLATGTVAGLFLDGTAQWLGKLWVYPYWTVALYSSCFVIGFSAYWLLLAESYLLTKSLLRPLFPPRPPRHSPKRHVRSRCGVFGVLLLAFALVVAVRIYLTTGGYQFSIAAPSSVRPPFYCFVLMMAGIWLILEFLGSLWHTDSLLSTLFRHDWLPGCALLVAGWTTGFLMETANAAAHFWLYTSWPFPNVTFWGVPILVLALWPSQYVVFLSISPAFAGTDMWG